jgi:hypothetical protein
MAVLILLFYGLIFSATNDCDVAQFMLTLKAAMRKMGRLKICFLFPNLSGKISLLGFLWRREPFEF